MWNPQKFAAFPYNLEINFHRRRNQFSLLFVILGTCELIFWFKCISSTQALTNSHCKCLLCNSRNWCNSSTWFPLALFFTFLVWETLLTREAHEIVPLVLPPLDELDVELGVEGLPLDGLWIIRLVEGEGDDDRPKPGAGEVRVPRVSEWDLSDLWGGVFGPKPIFSSDSEFLLETDFLWPEEEAGLLLLSRSMLLDMSRAGNSLAGCLPGEAPLMDLILLSPRSILADTEIVETSLTEVLLDEEPRDLGLLLRDSGLEPHDSGLEPPDSGILVDPLAVTSLAGILRGEGPRDWTNEEDTGLLVLSVASMPFDLAATPMEALEVVCTGKDPRDSGLISFSLLSMILLDKVLLGEFPLLIDFLGLSGRSTLLDVTLGPNWAKSLLAAPFPMLLVMEFDTSDTGERFGEVPLERRSDEASPGLAILSVRSTLLDKLMDAVFPPVIPGHLCFSIILEIGLSVTCIFSEWPKGVLFLSGLSGLGMGILTLSFLLTGTDSSWNEGDRFLLLVGHIPSDGPLLTGPDISADVSNDGVVEREDDVEEEGVEGRLSADWARLGREEVEGRLSADWARLGKEKAAVVWFRVAFGDGYLLGVLGVEIVSSLLEVTSFGPGFRIGLLAFLFCDKSNFDFGGSVLQTSMNFFLSSQTT
jgi:hypothetical protein